MWRTKRKQIIPGNGMADQFISLPQDDRSRKPGPEAHQYFRPDHALCFQLIGTPPLRPQPAKMGLTVVLPRLLWQLYTGWAKTKKKPKALFSYIKGLITTPSNTPHPLHMHTKVETKVRKLLRFRISSLPSWWMDQVTNPSSYNTSSRLTFCWSILS